MRAGRREDRRLRDSSKPDASGVRVAADGAQRGSKALPTLALPLIILIIALAATGILSYGLKKQAESNAAADFERDAGQLAETLSARMRDYEETMNAVVALFATSSVITRDDWRRFVDRLNVRREHPGVEVLGFAKRLDADQRVAHELDMRAQGLPEYRVWPPGERDSYVAVTFIEPFSAGTRRLLGYDMRGNPATLSAMERARNSGGASLSRRWAPESDEPSQQQATVLMFAPVYPAEGDALRLTRKRRLAGYVYAALRADDVVAEVTRNSALDLGFAIHDGEQIASSALLYANARARDALARRIEPAFERTIPISVAGHLWRLQFFSDSYAQAVPQAQLAFAALAAGIPMSFLLFGIVWSQTTLRARAVRLAQEMTQSLRSQAGLLDLTHDAVLLRDRDNIIRYWNRASMEQYGYSAEEAIGRTADNLLKTRFPQPLDQIWRELEQTDRWEGELVHTRRDGSELVVASRWAVQKDARGAIEAILETNNDVTAHRREQEERRRLEASLLQASKLEAMGTLAGGIAHDFNNILGAILGYGELAQNEAAAGSSLRRYVDSIMGAGLRAKSLVARILAFSRSGLGQRRPVHVQAVVAEALDLLSASVPDDVRVERDLAGEGAAVTGDPTQIHQVVMNLSTNALQAMKSGGVLCVRLDIVSLEAGLTVVTGTISAGEYVRLSVSDTGPGIEASLRERIFDPFFTTKGVGVGTGLGLSLVHGIATELGGGVDMRSEEGRGATFDVYFPCCGHAPPIEEQLDALPGGNGETVMLVDDEEVLVRLGEEILAKLGYEPVGYTSPADALNAFRSQPQRFDVVLTDETMPEMTGSQLAAEIRAMSKDVPIVLMSGYAAAPLAARAVAVGATDVLNKPLVARDIARSLQAALSKRSVR